MNFTAKIYVSFKPGILDPQGKTVQNTLARLGWDNLQNVRISRFVEMDITADTKELAEQQLTEICNKVLANPNTETWRFELEESE